MDEKEIIKEVLAGNSKAQRLLYEKYSRLMFMVCLRYAKNRFEAEDILQEGFLQIYRDLKQYRGNGALSAWMKKVMVNNALQYIRRTKKQGFIFEVEWAADIVSEECSVLDKMSAEELIRLIQRLPTGYRVVFNLYVIEGYSHREIADLLGIGISTSKSQLFKAKAALRHMFEKQLLS